jgi:ClpP class serine protease
VDPLSLLWLFFIVASLQPLFQRQMLAAQRQRRLAAIARKREAKVITLIHRQETFSFLGFPIARYIDIDDAESILRAIRETPNDRPIEIVLHTPGGLVLAATQIANALADHPAEVTAVVPHYAMSGGTLIALGADRIVMDEHAALGPVDPQIGQYPAASILATLEFPGDRKDETLILADVSRKAITQVETFVTELLERHLDPARARDVAHLLATGVWTHDRPLRATELQELGRPVQIGVGDEERELLTLYPQPRGREASVEYSPGVPGRKRSMPPARPRTVPERRTVKL